MAERQKELNSKETHLWQLYQQGISNQISLGIRQSIPVYVDFYEGRQWPSPTQSTKNLPRPVVNIVKMICRGKKAAILNSPVKIMFKSYSPMVDIDKFNDFYDFVAKSLGQDELDARAIDDGIKKGSYFYHYYWDSNVTGIDGRRDGGLMCELIDPLNIFFENPSQLDEQKQEWILVSSRLSINGLKKIADKDANLSELSPDNDCLPYNLNPNGEKITVLTRYFRIDGEVYCERATKGSIINKPFKIAPEPILQKEEPDKLRAPLYPIVCGYYEKKEGSIYGLSEIEGIIPNQKAINFNLAMSLLNAQECAWGKYIALPNALKGQKVSNAPGQVLIDYSGTGDGIKKMPEQSLSQVPIQITNTLCDLTRTVTGATEVMTGDGFNSGLSGAAIAYLQAQAQMPIEELKSSYYRAKRKQGFVVAQFLKLYYYEQAFARHVSYKNEEAKEILEIFNSSSYENAVLDVTVEAINGKSSSVAGDISLLDACLNNGSISIETYIKAYPDSAITSKQEILRLIKEEKAAANSQV
ncbi:MAG: hypothetical protein IJW54_05210 [Clostridia bacterium]|nr:hypothetical protein [Clostridia bacterium]